MGSNSIKKFEAVILRVLYKTHWLLAAYSDGRTETTRTHISILVSSCHMLIKDAIQQFSSWRQFKVKKQTVRGYDRELKNFCLFLRNPDIENIALSDVMDYLNGMADLGWDRNSFVGKCMALRKFFQFYRLQGYKVIDEELIPIPDKEPKLPRVATDEQFDQLISAIPKETNDPRHIRNLAILKLLWDTGARNGEICSINIEDLDLEERRAIIKTEKAKSRRPFREIFWTEATNECLKNWIKKREHLAKLMKFDETNALFLSVTTVKCGQRFTIKGVGEMLRKYCNRAKLPYMNAHSFRHHRGHHIIKSGGSTSDVMNILGHSSVQSTTIYTMMHGKELEQRARIFLADDPVKSPEQERDQKFSEGLKGMLSFMQNDNKSEEQMTPNAFQMAEHFARQGLFTQRTRFKAKVPYSQYAS
ncbi:MAG: tyrosine-type recombinase/integrase [Parcubacteria group bacterium]